LRKLLFIVTALLVLCIALPAAAVFTGYATDVEKHWSKEYVWYLQRNGLVDGYPDGTFRPDRQVTRAEFTKMFIKVATSEYCKVHQVKKEVKPGFKISQFKDHEKIPGWAKPFIEHAVKYGYINGFPDGTFRPDAPISKVEAVTIIGRTLNMEYDVSNLNYVDTIPDWTKPAVAKAHQYGLVETPKDGKFNPYKVMTRGDIAKFLYIYYVGEDIE